jgi:hypothetical protein
VRNGFAFFFLVRQRVADDFLFNLDAHDVQLFILLRGVNGNQNLP